MNIPLRRCPPAVQFTSDDHEVVWDIICASSEETDALALLWSELQRAAVISPGDAPDDLVRRDSIVEYRDLITNKRKAVRLVFEDAAERGDIAVTDSLGAALIGLRKGATFVWRDGDQNTHAVLVERVRPPQAPQQARAGVDGRCGGKFVLNQPMGYFPRRARTAAVRPARPDMRRRGLPEQPGTGSASQVPVTATIRRRPRSGRARRGWELVFEPTFGPSLEPLMGWTQMNDPLGGHTVAFPTARAAIGFAARKGWDYRLIGGELEDELSTEADLRNDQPCPIDVQLEQTFPASDPPSWTLGRDRSAD